MNGQLLGRKIREARLAKKMTQTEVVGTFITRNMLSQIESGIATPSVKTLEYLAGVLEIPLSQLVSEDDTSPIENLTAAKNAYKNRSYQEAIDIIEEPDTQDALYDEYCALLAKAYSNLSDKQSQEKAAYYSKLGIYAK